VDDERDAQHAHRQREDHQRGERARAAERDADRHYRCGDRHRHRELEALHRAEAGVVGLLLAAHEARGEAAVREDLPEEEHGAGQRDEAEL
jgi:hypothetical protein